jgi:DNA-binding CsgD family transcriptional regulator
MLIGRTEETTKLSSLLDQTRAGMSGALVLRGEAGIGKTALLDTLAELAQDLSVVRLEGIESEMQLGYAALHRLLLPFLGRVVNLPAPQRDALQSAFGLASSAPADRFLVGLAALTLLGDVATDRALVILVDDTQWLDRESVNALVFVARRLYADQIALVFAARDAPETDATFQDIPILPVEGLDKDSAREILTSSVSDQVSHRVAERIIAATRGNPLALRELSGELTTEHLSDHAPLPDPLPIGELIEARFLRQVRQLPVDTQLILLVAAADPEGDPHTLHLAGERLDLSASDIEPAVRDGLLVINPRVEFRHPLVRSAVYSGATAEDRRRAHHALASVMDARQDPDRRALHMALAAVRPDEDLARALEQSAADARARGGYIAESSFLARAASLTPDLERRASRLLAAAGAAFLAGNPGYSESLLDQARPDLIDPVERAQAQRLDGDLRLLLGQPHLGPSLLIEAARAFEPLDRALSHYALLEAFQTIATSLGFTEGVTDGEIAQKALASLDAQTTPLTAADVLLKGVATRCAGNYRLAVPSMREAVHAHATMTPEELIRFSTIGQLLTYDLWDETLFRDIVYLHETTARAQGSLATLWVTLLALSMADVQAGRFETARERYSELDDVNATMGTFLDLYEQFDVHLLAWQGDERTPARAAQIREGASAFHMKGVSNCADLALSIFALGQGDYETAFTAARAIADDVAFGWTCRALPILVEAGTRCGRDETASAALELLIERASSAGTPWALGLLARCRAVVTKDSSAADHYEEALANLGQTSWLTEVAHTHLLYGEWLRRQKRRLEAREQLRRAYEMFETMGAAGFSERARIELLATGERVRRRRVETAHELTSRELQVARLAAERATSREIGGQLFISANTVDYHLRNVFQKLGISSRRELVGVLPDEIDQ